MSQGKRRSILYGTCIVLAAGLLFAGFGITVPPDPGARLSGAPLIAQFGDYDGAVAICDKVLEEHPGNVDALVFRATFLAQGGRYDAALEAYDELLERDEFEAGMRRNLRSDRASVLLHAGREDEFKAERDALAKGGMDKFVLMLDGVAARKRGDLMVAAACFRRAVKKDANSNVARSLLIDVLVLEGKKELAAGRFSKARELYTSALDVDPKRMDVALRIVEVEMADGNDDKALRALKAMGRVRAAAPLAFRIATERLIRVEQEGVRDALRTAYMADRRTTTSLFKKDPAWADLRSKATLRELVSKGDTASGTGLPGKGRVIGSQQNR